MSSVLETSKLTIQTDEILDYYRLLKTKAAAINTNIKTNQARIDELNEKYAAYSMAGTSLSVSVNDPEFDLLVRKSLNSQKEYIEKLVHQNQKELDAHLADVSKINESLDKINKFIFLSVSETMKPEERERIVSGRVCSICTENNINRALDCGHTMCDKCVTQIGISCPMCRRRYKQIIKLFMNDDDDNIGVSSSDVPNPTVPISPWFRAGELIGVNTVGSTLRANWNLNGGFTNNR